MAGLWHLSQQQIVDAQGKPISGARAYFYAADTLTPLDTYKDYGLGTANPNPLIADGYGRWPVAYLDEADGFYRYRLTTPGGSVLVDLTVLPIIGPSVSEGGGSDVPVDPDTLMKTGMIVAYPGTGTLSGFVRVNGRTIGSATSGATERANADTEALFTFLWGAYDNTVCPVSGGRGVSGAADFAANKTITLLDWRGRAPFGLDDMGNSAASRLTSGALGNTGGAETVTVAKANLPASTLAISGTTAAGGDHGHPFRLATSGDGDLSTNGALALDNQGQTNYPAYSGDTPSATNGQQIGGSGTHTHTFTAATEAMGSGTALNKMPPYAITGFYQKL
jgi:hypothetical protein